MGATYCQDLDVSKISLRPSATPFCSGHAFLSSVSQTMFIKVVALESGGGLLAVPPVGYTLALGRGLSLPVAAVTTVPEPESDEEKDCITPGRAQDM